jgi:ribosomal protein L29
VKPVGANMTQVDHGRAIILYSYQTPVAIYVPGVGTFVTSKHHSVTTSRHISKWGVVPPIVKVSQDEIEALARDGAAPARNPTLAILGNPGGLITPGNLLSESNTLSESMKVLRDLYSHLNGHGMKGLAAEVAGVVYKLDELRGQAAAGYHKNPRRKKLARKVLVIDYVHAEDGKKYTHDFGEDTDHGPVCAYVEDGGKRVVLEASDGRAIVKDY